MSRLRRLLPYLRPYSLAFAGTLVASFIASVLEGLLLALLIPVTRMLFDAAPGSGGSSLAERVMNGVLGSVVGGGAVTITTIVIMVIVTVVLKNAASYMAAYSSVYIQEGVTRDLRSDLFDHVLKMDLGFLQRTRGGQLSSRLVADVEHAHHLLNVGLQSLLSNGLMVLVYLAMLFALSWRLAVVTLVLAPLIALGTKPIFLRVRDAFVHAAERRGDLTAVFAEAVAGARIVKASGGEAPERRRFQEALGDYYHGTLKGHRLSLLTHPISETFAGLVFALLLVLGMRWASGGSVPVRPEAFITFLAVTLRMLPAVKRLAHFPAVAEEALAGADRVLDTLETRSADLVLDRETRFPGLSDAIVFDGVTFAYGDDPPAVQDVSFRVGRGELVALVGPSGSGKSTLLDLLVRFFDPVQGAVRLDGVPTTTYTRASLRAAMGVVSQEGILFNDTVRANIAYGTGVGMNQAAVEAAARCAKAHEFILKLPAAYDTVLGERGTRLSGGERQRIAIARALARDPSILIMDEATSSLDTDSETALRLAMADVVRGRTVLVVAHRLSTVAGADRIVVMDRGRVDAIGTHPELLESSHLYRRLYETAVV